jgi:hypothetical protein
LFSVYSIRWRRAAREAEKEMTRQTTIQKLPSTPYSFIRKNVKDWDEIDDLFYRTGSWIWFNMPDDYLLEKIIVCTDWWYIHKIIEREGIRK